MVDGVVESLCYLFVIFGPQGAENRLFAHSRSGIEQEEKEFHSSRHPPVLKRSPIEYHAALAKGRNSKPRTRDFQQWCLRREGYLLALLMGAFTRREEFA